MSEADLKAQVIDYLRLKGAWVFPTAGSVFHRRGIPDILACVSGGRFFACECKRTGGKLSPYQEVELQLIRQAGGLAIVAYDLDDVIDALSGEHETNQRTKGEMGE